MVRVRGVFGVLAAAALFLSLSLPSATAVAQYIPNEPVAPLEDEWRALIGSDWSRFQMLPNSFRYDGTGHGGFEFVGALTDTPLFDGRAIERVEGVMFLQCPTRRAAIVSVRFFDTHGDRLAVQMSERSRVKFLFAAPRGAVDELIERACTNSLATVKMAREELGYRPTRPVLGVTSIRGIALGVPLPDSIPACGELSPRRHAELLNGAGKATGRCAVWPNSSRDTALLMTPMPASDRTWDQAGTITFRGDGAVGIDFYIDPKLLDDQMSRMVAEFGLPTEVRTRADDKLPNRMSRQFNWIGENQVLSLVDSEYFDHSRATLTVTRFLTREEWVAAPRPRRVDTR